MTRAIKYYFAFFTFIFLASATTAQEDALNLSSALEKALENNYGIIISESQANIAGLNNNWGTAGRYPSVGFDASSSNNMELINNSSANRLYGSIGMNWTLFDGYRVNITKSKLDKLENLAKGRSAVVVENTIQNVILGYYNVLLQKEQLDVMKRVTGLSRDRYEYEQMRRDMGSSLTYNVLQAKNVYLEDSASYLNQQVVVRNAIRNLNFVLGEEASAQWNFTESFEPDISVYKLGDLIDKMRSNNQTLQNQYASLMIRKEDTRLRESELYPSLRFSAGLDNSFSRTKNEGMDALTTKTVAPYANMSLSYDIYTGGTRKQAIEVARINEEIARTEIEEMEHSLTNVLFNQYDLYNVRRTLLNVASENLEAAELNLEIAEEKFKSGAINSFNYRDIQLIYLNAALQRLRAVYNLVDSNTNLTRLIGGFVEEGALIE
ncbi:MAG: TolC family protein [Bacteroidales bacterium]|nr:TolC family protein [Bacteroidales bacterium]